MKSNNTTNRPLMKMLALDIMSSRPQHETRKPVTEIATAISREKSLLESKGFKK
jgi:hypothetical protein